MGLRESLGSLDEGTLWRRKISKPKITLKLRPEANYTIGPFFNNTGIGTNGGLLFGSSLSNYYLTEFCYSMIGGSMEFWKQHTDGQQET